MRSYTKDYEYGKSKEEEILPIICKFFNDDIKQSNKRYTKYDYIGKNYLYEVKSRTNKLNDFPDTLLPKSKIIPNKKQIFIFNFTDKIGYIEYSEEVFKNIPVKQFKRKFREGFNDKFEEYYHIPINLLLVINK